MHKLTLTASDGEVLTGQIPASWAEVPLAAYAELAATARPIPNCITQPTAHAYASVAGCEALAKLLGLPTAEPLLADVSLLRRIYQAAPFLFAGPLPAAGAVPGFTHLGIDYTYCGGLPNATGGQLEGLLTFLAAHEGHPLGGGPNLLAILYKPAGEQKPHTAEMVRDMAHAFATLPVSIAYPALTDFMQRSAPWYLATQRYSAALPAAEQALSALQAAMASASPAHSWSMRRWLGKVWLRRVTKLLRTFLLPSATTATPLNSPPTSRPGAKSKGLRFSLRFRFTRR